MSYKVLSAIIRGNWAIEESFAQSYMPIIENIIKGRTAFEVSKPKPKGYAHFEESGSIDIEFNCVDDNGDIQENSVGVVNIIGPLTKYDQDCGPIGMVCLSDIVKSMDNNPKVIGIVLKIDSPGGTVDGTQQLAEAVKNCTKPIIAFVDDTMASAALWIGTSAKEVYAGKENDMIGSIGVMMSFLDLIPYYEALGANYHSIVADQSPDKNKIFDLVREGKYDEYRKTMLDPIAEDFIKAVKSKRPNVRDDQMTGKMYYARELVGTLIDGIKSFDDCIKRVVELSKESKTTATVTSTASTANFSKTNNKNSSMKKLTNLNKAVGAELESADGGIFLTEEQAEKADAALVQNEQTATDLQNAIKERDTANASLTTATEKVSSLETEIAELRKGAGAKTAVVVTETETDNSDDKTMSFDMPLADRIALMNSQKAK